MLKFPGSLLLLPLAVAFVNGSAVANQSLVLLPGEKATIAIPAVTPLTVLGDTRLELRINRHLVPSANTNVFQHAGFTITLRPNGEVCAIDYIDSLPDMGNMMCADITSMPDVVLRVQRDTVQQQFELEVHSAANDATAVSYCGSKVNGTQGNVLPCPIRTVNYSSWAGSAILGGTLTNVQIAWIKWYSNVVPPCTGSFSENNPADLADWRFETGTDNLGTSGIAITVGPLQAASNALGADVGDLLAATPILPPSCNAGRQQVFRAGYPAQLDATASYPLDGGASLQYSWQEVSGPSTVMWSDQTAAQPTVTGLVFGSYVFMLTVTDGSSQSISCTIKHGAVATDDNNVVITGNSALDALIGPQIRFGANPWPWFDNRHKAAADVQVADLDPYYSSYWDTPGPGTVTVTSNSKTVTGFGTTFTTTFCQGPANPTIPKVISGDVPVILVWYPTGVAGQTGRRGYPVVGCQSDTSLTLYTPWGADIPAGANLSYSYVDDATSGNWLNNVSPANFYDNVTAFYTLYYRSGIDDYLNAARKLADRFWVSPRIDRGNACGINAQGMCAVPRNLSLLGLTLRALDGRDDMWPGMRVMWDKFMGFDLSKLDVTPGAIWDLREEAYHLTFISECALSDPDPVHRAACKTAISQSFQQLWTPFKFPDGSWAQLYYAGMGGSWGYSSWDTGSSVTLTNGSATVVGNGTPWSSDMFRAPCEDGSPAGCAIWFTNTPSKPANNAGGDSATYTATFVDATHLTLDRPYEGASGVHGWAVTNGPTAAGLIGWGAQPYMMGIISTAFDLAAKAIADSDPSGSAVAHSYNVTAANWIKNNAFRAPRKGLYYGAGYVNCQPPISETNVPCTGNDNDSQSRTLSSEVMRGIGAAYAYSGDSALQAFGDTLFSAMFSKPASGGPDSDGLYVTDWNDTIGWYMYGTPPIGKAPKYFGMFFGFGDGSSWPAYRLGALVPAGAETTTAAVPIHPAGPVRVRAFVTAPSGQKTESLCTRSTCTVEVDRRQGEHLVTLEYFNESGKLIRTEQTSVSKK